MILVFALLCMFNFPMTTWHHYFATVDASFVFMLLTPSCEVFLNTTQVIQQLIYLRHTDDIIYEEYDRV